MEFKSGKIVPISIGKEMSTSYINYAMSVIIGRALPDVRDGLKPVHRRVLYGMYELNLGPDKPHKKSARVVGEVMGKYHPHGDAAIYDTMVRMAQDFSMRYVLVDGHGNFGSIDGDSAAAMRYTEARLSPFAMEMLADIDKETVDFQPNFDESLEEPAVLPARVPNLLVNGSSGIAVGMATNMPPHNLTEVIDAISLMIKDHQVSIDKLMRAIKGPDFPTGGLILGYDGIKKAYRTGRGAIKVRARTQIENMSNGKTRILITELPYQVNKAKLIEDIAELVKDKKVEGITDLRDESDRSGLRVVIELRRDTNPKVILNQLFKHTQMQTSFGVINLAIVEGQPKYLNLRELLHHYLEHQKDVVTRRTRFELRKAEERAHILEGLRIALDNLDAIIKLIRASKDRETAKKGLMENFALSERQAVAILEMQLQRLTGLEREKIEKEYAEVTATIAHLQAVLADERMVYDIINAELQEIKKKYGDKRRTEIVADVDDFQVEDLIAEEDIIITMTHQGYIKRLSINTYRSQRRGGRGIKGMNTKEEDFVEQLFITTTHHHMLFFTNKGKVYQLKAHEIPEQGRAAKGTAIINLLQLQPGEKVHAIIPVRDFAAAQYLVMATKRGIVKKTELIEFANLRKNGIIAINLDDDDDLISVRLTDGNQKLLIATNLGMAICFHESDIRSMGRASRGVKGISLGKNDEVIGMDIVTDGADVLTVTSNGMGKRTPVEAYRLQSRGGKGIKNIKLTEKNGKVIALKLVKVGNEVMMSSRDGVIICIPVEDIPRTGRDAQGSRLMRLAPNDEVVDVAQSIHRDEAADGSQGSTEGEE